MKKFDFPPRHRIQENVLYHSIFRILNKYSQHSSHSLSRHRHHHHGDSQIKVQNEIIFLTLDSFLVNFILNVKLNCSAVLAELQCGHH